MDSSAVIWFVIVAPLGVTILGAAMGSAQDRRQRRNGRRARGYVTDLGVAPGDGMSGQTYWAEVSCAAEPVSIRVRVEADRYRALRKGGHVYVVYRPDRRRHQGVLL